MKNFEMKTFKLMMLTALIAITSFSLTSCLNDNSDPSNTTLGTIAAVSYNMGYLTFTNGSLTYIPSSSSVASLEAKGAEFDKYGVVYITYTSNDTYEAGKTKYNIELTGVVNLDNKVDILNDEATLNDSINNPKMEPIIELQNWSTSGTSQYMVIMDNDHVLVYANYFLNKNAHKITLKYCPDQTTSGSDGINLYLCNNGEGDKSTAYTSSAILQANGASYASLCYRAFNISVPLLDYKHKTGKSTVKINIIAHQNTTDVSMSGGEEKTYSYDYTIN
jgi:hypothetical protein